MYDNNVKRVVARDFEQILGINSPGGNGERVTTTTTTTTRMRTRFSDMARDK